MNPTLPSRQLRPTPLSRSILRLRCPHCGQGAVFAGMFTVRERCERCGFVFKRGNPAYFSGAIFINYLLGAGSCLALFLFTLIVTWPSVPWTTITYAGPVAALLLVVGLNPISKAILMAVDVRMRPVTEDELRDGPRESGW